MHQHPWISLNIRENAWIYCSNCTRTLNIHGHLLKILQTFEDAWASNWVRVLNMARMYTQGLRRVPNMSDYDSIRLNNVWICLNIPQYIWTWLNIAECSRIPANFLINFFDCVSGFAICRDIVIQNYNYCNKFLSVRFVHPGSLLPFYFLTRVRT